jgi:hypothetical protein
MSTLTVSFLGLAAALVFAASPSARGQTGGHDAHMHAFEECAKACGACQRACDSCATHCQQSYRNRRERYKDITGRPLL